MSGWTLDFNRCKTLNFAVCNSFWKVEKTYPSL